MSRLLDERVFNKETLLDSTVNLVPFFIMLGFLIMFAVATPMRWREGAIFSIYMWTLVISMMWSVLHITYAAAKRI